MMHRFPLTALTLLVDRYVIEILSTQSILNKFSSDTQESISNQVISALFIGLLEHIEGFRNLKFAVKRITNIQSTVLSSSEGTATCF